MAFYKIRKDKIWVFMKRTSHLNWGMVFTVSIIVEFDHNHWRSLFAVGTFFSYQSNGLAPTGKKLFGAVGCAVVLPGPEQIGTSKFIKWEYKKDESVTKELLILMYYVETHDLQIRVKYQDDADFNETDGSLRLRKLQLNDRGLYRYRLSTTTGKWIQLEVISKFCVYWSAIRFCANLIQTY